MLKKLVEGAAFVLAAVMICYGLWCMADAADDEGELLDGVHCIALGTHPGHDEFITDSASNLTGIKHFPPTVDLVFDDGRRGTGNDTSYGGPCVVGENGEALVRVRPASKRIRVISVDCLHRPLKLNPKDDGGAEAFTR